MSGLADATGTAGCADAIGRKVPLLGFQIDALTLEETLAEVDCIIARGRPVQHCAINAAKAVRIQSDAHLRDIVSTCELVSADGVPIVWASRLLGHPLPGRVNGTDMFERLLARAEARGYGVYFLGATPEVVEAVVRRALQDHPRLRVSGFHHGYVSERDTETVVAQAQESRPDILFVGMPTPRKEYWLFENLERLGIPFCMGVGGSFDVYAGKVRRAPRWMQRSGLEWFYRFLQEPGRMWKRYLVGNAAFIRLVGEYYLNADGRRNGRHGAPAGRRRTE